MVLANTMMAAYVQGCASHQLLDVLEYFFSLRPFIHYFVRASAHLCCADNCRLCKLNCTYLVAHHISISLIYQRREISLCGFLKIKLLGVFDLFGDANSSTLINKKNTTGSSKQIGLCRIYQASLSFA